MNHATRREFLKASAALGFGALSAPPLFALTEDAKPVAMSVAKLSQISSRFDPQDMNAIATALTKQAMHSLGGMARFVSNGDVVWVKPNIGWDRGPELAANTHPQVVAELVRQCYDAGAKKVYVGDHTCNKREACYENSGIAPAVRAVDGEMVFLDRSRFRDMSIGGKRLKSHPVYPAIIETDLCISVPVCKHHGSTQVSLAMKNYMGVVEKRGVFHQDLPTTIADITKFMKPTLSVLDATRMLTEKGPTGGDIKYVKTMHTVAAGTDIVALDAFGSRLLGNNPQEIETVTKGAAYGLGEVDYRKLKPVEVEVA